MQIIDKWYVLALDTFLPPHYETNWYYLIFKPAWFQTDNSVWSTNIRILATGFENNQREVMNY